MWKRIVSSLVGVSMILCGFVGVSMFMEKLPAQEPIEVETVKDAPAGDSAPKSAFAVAAKGAILIDAESGEVLFEQDAHTELPLASVTKVMTMLLIMEAVESGKITLDDPVTISERAASMGGSQMYMEAGETHTVAQLMEGVAMASANDGCVALAEFVAGSEEIFVERMNERAEELGMRDTHFVNTNGLPVADHYSSAYDIAVMSRKLYAFEETHKWFTTWQSTITVGLPGKEKEFGLTNTNKLIKTYPGCNGIKTGFTAEAGYCLSASASREDTHLIAVALGCETSKIRNAQVAKLFDYGFANFGSKLVANEGEVLTRMKVERGTPQEIDVVSAEKVTCLVQKGKEDRITTRIELSEEVPLPLAAGDKVGELHVMKEGKEVGVHDLLAEETVEKASLKQLILRALS